MTGSTLNSSPTPSITRQRQAADKLQAHDALRARLLVDGRFWPYDMSMNPELRDKGYLPVKGLLEPTLARVLHKTLLLQQWRRESFRDNHIPTAASVTKSALTDALLLELRPRIEAIAACPLVPTYSYARVYFHGDAMVRHRDRGSLRDKRVNSSRQRWRGRESVVRPGAKVGWSRAMAPCT